MKTISVTCGLVLAASGLVNEFAQAQSVQSAWQFQAGGGQTEVLYSAIQTSDGGFLLGGKSNSGIEGNKSASSLGGADFWIVRLDANGSKLWDRTFGGTGDDILFSLRETTNGDFVLGGSSASGVNGNKTATNKGGTDFWVVRIDANGTKLWDKSIGGGDDDTLEALEVTADGGILCAGFSASVISGDKTTKNWGGSDFWLVKLDANGNKVWDKTYGGTGDDFCYSIAPAGNGGYVLAGSSASGTGGNKTSGNSGMTDFWAVRVDANGDKVWDASYGGTNEDGITSVSIVAAPAGGFLIGGDSFSGINGQRTKQNFGQDDFWVVRIDTGGAVLWDAAFGGTGNDYLTAVQTSVNGGFVLAGGSTSGITGNKTTASFGSVDYWLVGIDSAGSKAWESVFGGSSLDGFINVALWPASDGGYLLAGDSFSGATGNKTTASYGGSDFWAVKLTVQSPAKLRVVPQTNVANGFDFYLQGTIGHTYVTEFSTNFLNWTPLSTNTLATTEIPLTDNGAQNSSARFYRAHEK